METGKNLYGSSSKAQKKTKNVIGINVMGVFFYMATAAKLYKKKQTHTHKVVLKQNTIFPRQENKVRKRWIINGKFALIKKQQNK